MSERTTRGGAFPWSQTISKALNLRPGDGWPLAVLLAHSCLKGAARVLTETPANALFLSRFTIETLPLVYICTAVVCTGIGLVFARMESRISLRALLAGTLGFLSIVTLGFYFALSEYPSQPVVFGTMVWKDVHWTLMNLEFWALAGVLLDVRQGKRLFGMIATGEIVAGMLGGFSVPLLIRSGGTLLLLVAAAATTVASMCLLFYTLKSGQQHLESGLDEAQSRKPWITLFKDRYLALFFGVSALSLFGEFFIDYSFYNRVELAFADEAKLAAFFGLFYGVLGAGQLVSSAWISGRCLTRYGLSFGLLALPLVVLATTGTASAAQLFGAAVVVLFWTIVAAKFFDSIIRDTIEIPSSRILYQPLPANERLRVQTVRETIVEPMSLGIVGVLLWLGQSLFAIEPGQVLYWTVAIAVAWAALSWLLRREYTTRLTLALTARRLGGGSLSLDDQSSINVLLQGLESASAGQVMYCLDMIEDVGHPLLEAKLIELLEHCDPVVRRHVISKIERLRLSAAGSAISAHLPVERSAEIKAALLRALCATNGADVVQQASEYLNDPSLVVRCGAMVGLLRYGGSSGISVAGSRLQHMTESVNPTDRRLAAEVLGEIGTGSFYQPLLRLVRDEQVSVRRAAIESARKLHALGAIPAMIEALEIVAVRSAAARALVELGEPALGPLEEAFVRPGQTPELQGTIVQIVGRIGTEGASAILRGQMHHSDGDVRAKVLAAMVHCRQMVDAPEVAAAREMIVREAEEAAWALAVWSDIEVDATHAELSRALLGELESTKQRMFLLLSLIYSPAVIRKAQLDLEKGTSHKKAHALEVLDNLLSQDLKRLVFPLVDQIALSERKRQLHAIFPQPRMEPAARLSETLQQSATRIDAWTIACALYVAGNTRAPEAHKLAASRLKNREAVVRETAEWILTRVSSNGADERATATGVIAERPATD
jgi:AAA family ATP:ADP antiporter